jgi:hypothetical protein
MSALAARAASRTLAALILLAAPPVLARAADAAESRFRVAPSGPGPQRLDLPPEFLSASAHGDLADLRLLDAAGREVPYLVITQPEKPPRWAAAVRIRPIPTTKTESGAELDLAAVREVSGLALTFPRSGFVKKVRVEGSADRQRWVTLLAEDTLYDLPVDPAACGSTACPGRLSRGELRFEAASLRFLRVVLDDRRSPRLPLPGAAKALLAGGRGGAPASGPTVPLAIAPRDGEPGVSRFALRLPGPHLPTRAVLLEVDAPRLARRAHVLEARLSGGRLVPVELGSAPLVRVERGGVTVSGLRIPVGAPEETELELVVEDGDNPHLALRSAQAELAPLPWIFFESPDGAALEARLGDPERRAPRYDLEALRPELPRARPGIAHAQAAFAAAPVPAPTAPAVGDAGGAGAPLDTGVFRHRRAVSAAPVGLAAVRLDAAVLAGSSDLSDVRVRTPDGRQLPYLLEQRDEPLAMPLAVPLATAAGASPDLPRALVRAGLSAHALALPQPAFPGARLVLETSARVFTREVDVYLDPDPHRPGHRGPVHLASASWAHADPSRPAPPLTVTLPALRADRLLVTLDDGDNAPLPLTAARMLLPSYRLRFFHPGTALELLYGADAVAAPRYDLALLAPRLRAASAREVTLGAAPADALAADGGTGAGRMVFWAVLGAAVLGLLALVARLVGRGGDAPPVP